MKKLLPFILILALLIPGLAIAEDSVHQIVEDYKQLELMLKSGKINQATHQEELVKLEARAEYLARKEVFDVRKEHGILKQGETPSDQKYMLIPQGNTEEEQIYLQILRGFTDKPT